MGDPRQFMARAIALSEKTSLVDGAGSAFGAVIVMDGKIVGEGANRVVAENDPTWHGEVAAIRSACKALGTFTLDGATLYASAEPCPMCMTAAYWAGIGEIYYAATVEDVLAYGDFDRGVTDGAARRPGSEHAIPTRQMMRDEAVAVWKKYKQKDDHVPY